ncbi:hypothetical protein FH972_012651 [Carpinus fangiana]|uniref:BTB domain-containing protein n=1 Tax=Carpinus fangiana TaxID=176857 RepID=A0A5N6R5Z4_9ROSI|nr:hypothetical protein FH972_012651 [Carpinus fangiana]
MFTNGMSETMSSEVSLMDVSPEAFKAMLEFMYSGGLDMEVIMDSSALLLQLLFLADQFGVTLLHQECCKTLLEYLSEDSVGPILQVVSSISSCKLIEETCERKFAMHFDYCTTASLAFVLLDETTFSNIIQHPDLTVTSEEKVLNAILMWGLGAKELYGWEVVDELIINLAPEHLFGEGFCQFKTCYVSCDFRYFRMLYLRSLISLIFVILQLEKSRISRHIHNFESLVEEAINYVEFGLARLENQNARFQHKRSSYKELQYICDGDSNGVLYFAGTSYGKHQCPFCLRITITASSPPSQYTDPKVLASRTYQGTSFAGPRMQDGHRCAWWAVDTG